MTAMPAPALLDAPAAPAVRAASAAWPLWVLAVVALLPRMAFLAHPFESDSGLYVYMGKVVLAGQTLYRDFYETKLPGVPLFAAGLYTVFGDHWWAYVALQSAMTVLAAAALARAARWQYGRPAFGRVMLFALVFLNFSPAAYRGFQLETVQTFLSCIGAYFAVRAIRGGHRSADALAVQRRTGSGHAFLLGLFAGAGAMIKPTAGAVAAAYVITLCVRRRAVALPLIATLAGALIVPLVVLAWTWRAGLLTEMPGLLREISLYGSQTPRVFEDLFKPLFILLIGGFPFMAVWVFRRDSRSNAVRPARLAACPKGRDPVAKPLPNQQPVVDALVLAGAWFVIECLGIYVQGRMYAYHMLPLAAPLALLFGAACGRGRRPLALLAGLGPVVLFSLAFNLPEFRTLLTTGPRNLAVSDYLLAHAGPGETVVGDGIERLLMETRLRCGSRYAHLFYFANHDAAPTEFGRRFVDDLDRNRPTWAVFETDRAARHHRQADELPMYALRPARRQNFLQAWEKVDAYLERHYLPVAQVDGMTIYRRASE